VRSGLTLAALGLVVGLPLSFVMFRVVASALTGLTDAFNPWLPFLVVTSALALMAGLACLLPARKAAGIEPVRALQGD